MDDDRLRLVALLIIFFFNATFDITFNGHLCQAVVITFDILFIRTSLSFLPHKDPMVLCYRKPTQLPTIQEDIGFNFPWDGIWMLLRDDKVSLLIFDIIRTLGTRWHCITRVHIEFEQSERLRVVWFNYVIMNPNRVEGLESDVRFMGSVHHANGRHPFVQLPFHLH